MCTACGAYSAKQVNNLCLPCPGRATCGSRVKRFLKGLHPKDNGVSLGDAWLPPDAVVEALLSHQSRETPGGRGEGPTGATGNGQASVLAGSPGYRVAALSAMGLDEEALAELVAERAKPRGNRRGEVQASESFLSA